MKDIRKNKLFTFYWKKERNNNLMQLKVIYFTFCNNWLPRSLLPVQLCFINRREREKERIWVAQVLRWHSRKPCFSKENLIRFSWFKHSLIPGAVGLLTSTIIIFGAYSAFPLGSVWWLFNVFMSWFGSIICRNLSWGARGCWFSDLNQLTEGSAVPQLAQGSREEDRMDRNRKTGDRPFLFAAGQAHSPGETSHMGVL